jgi:hypothetical protein
MTEQKACVACCPTQVRRLREENDSLVASLQSQHSQGQEYTQELSALRETVKVVIVFQPLSAVSTRLPLLGCLRVPHGPKKRRPDDSTLSCG